MTNMVRMRNKGLGRIAAILALAIASSCRGTPDDSQDRAAIEQVFNKYLQSLNGADVELASQVWLQSPDIDVVTPIGRFKGWESVKKDIYIAGMQQFAERNVQPSNVSILVVGDAAWLVYDFVYTAKQVDGQALTFKGWESHGYQRTANGWRIAHLHYSVPPSPS